MFSRLLGSRSCSLSRCSPRTSSFTTSLVDSSGLILIQKASKKLAHTGGAPALTPGKLLKPSQQLRDMSKRPRCEETIPPGPLDETLRLACIREHERLVAATPDFTAFLACLALSRPGTLLTILRKQSLRLAGGRGDRLARIATHVMESSKWPCWRRGFESEAGDAIKVKLATLLSETQMLSELG